MHGVSAVEHSTLPNDNEDNVTMKIDTRHKIKLASIAYRIVSLVRVVWVNLMMLSSNVEESYGILIFMRELIFQYFFLEDLSPEL